jgi:hypothetical protein
MNSNQKMVVLLPRKRNDDSFVVMLVLHVCLQCKGIARDVVLIEILALC